MAEVAVRDSGLVVPSPQLTVIEVRAVVLVTVKDTVTVSPTRAVLGDRDGALTTGTPPTVIAKAALVLPA
jgi:hypothetical protein